MENLIITAPPGRQEIIVITSYNAPPELLIYTMEWEEMPGHVLLNIDRFDEQDGKTTWTSRSVFETVEDRDGMFQQGMETEVNEITERINELLVNEGRQSMMEANIEQPKGNGTSITITRVFDAPRERVWQRWTDPDQYLCWLGPKDYTACFAKIDLHVGGKYLNCMRGPDGKEYWSTGIYKEIIEPNRFVCTDSFADEHGNIVPATYYGMESEMPAELEVEVTLEDIGGGKRQTPG